MTIEEAIRILDPDTTAEALAEVEYYGGFRGNEALVKACEDACIVAVDALKRARWIPCSERMPDLIHFNAGTAYSEAVNVWTTGRKVMVGVWDGIDWIVPFDFWQAWGEKITHWQPLTELPEEGGAGNAAD